MDDIDVYLIRAGAETFERPLTGGSWSVAEPKQRATYVSLSQIIDFPAEFQGMLTYIDEENRVMIGAPVGYGVMLLLPKEELTLLKKAFKQTNQSTNNTLPR